MANSYKIVEGGPTHADTLMLGNATDAIGTLSVGTVAAAGANQGAATALTNKVIQTVTESNDAKGVLLPAGFAGQIILVANTVADKYLLVYPTGTGTINGGAGGAAWNVPNGTLGVFVCSAAGVWHCSSAVGA